ncbi:MAG: hypothetical protein AAGE88_11065 [Actinomycetota bacterium]
MPRRALIEGNPVLIVVDIQGGPPADHDGDAAGTPEGRTTTTFG